MPSPTLSINRAPVLTLWAAVVAERLGFEEDEALSLGKAPAVLNAQTKGRRLRKDKPLKIIQPECGPGHVKFVVRVSSPRTPKGPSSGEI
jgi:hypothetical protein